MPSLAAERIPRIPSVFGGAAVRRRDVMVVEPGFRHSRFRPMGHARNVVDDYWVVQAARCRTAIEASLPDASVLIYFNLGPSGRHLVGISPTCQPALRGILPAGLAHRPAWVIGPHAETLLIEKETRDCDIRAR